MSRQPTPQDIEASLVLLHEAHQRLLDSHSYVADALIYRAILRLSGGMPPKPSTDDQPAIPVVGSANA